jgi:cytochrome c oxidase cbb3-type subunit 3
MAPRIERLAWGLAAGLCVGLCAGLGGCAKASGGSSTEGTTQLPADQVLSRIPLGAPPGEPISAGVRNPFEGDAQAVQDGKTLFASMNCVYCHGSQGSGLIGPPLDTPGWRYGGAPAQIYNSIHDGRPQGMPAWGARLPPDQIWRLTAYIESLGGAEPPATPQMAQLGGPQASTTGPEPADQVQADTAHDSLIGAERARRR